MAAAEQRELWTREISAGGSQSSSSGGSSSGRDFTHSDQSHWTTQRSTWPGRLQRRTSRSHLVHQRVLPHAENAGVGFLPRRKRSEEELVARAKTCAWIRSGAFAFFFQCKTLSLERNTPSPCWCRPEWRWGSAERFSPW